jgi:hypothetical protein
MRRLTIALCCTALLVAGALCGAADTGGATAAPDQKDDGTAQKPPVPTVQAVQPAPAVTPDTFHPSEEISEDRSVSFPVDI